MGANSRTGYVYRLDYLYYNHQGGSFSDQMKNLIALLSQLDN